MEQKGEYEKVQQFSISEERRTETVQSGEMNIYLKTFYCLVVALMGLGFGFSICAGTLVTHWDCYSNKTVVLDNLTTTEGTSMGSSESPVYSNGFYDGFKLTPNTCFSGGIYSFYISVIFLSGLLASILNVFVNFGLKWSLFISNVFYALGFGLNIYAMQNSAQAIIARIFQGMGSSLTLCNMDPFIQRFSPERLKSFLKVFGPACISIGALITTLFGMIQFPYVHDYSYVFTGYGCLFAFFAMIILTLPNEQTNEVVTSEETPVVKSILTKIKENKKGLFIVSLLQSGQQLCLINAVFMFANDVFKDSITNGELLAVSPLIGPVIMAASNVTASLTSAVIGFFVKDMRYLYFISHIATTICLIILGINFQPALFSCIFVFCFSMGLGPLVWAMTTGYFKKDFEREGMIYGTVVNMLFSFFIPFACKSLKTFGINQYLYLGSASIMILYGIMLIKLTGVFKAALNRLR